METIKQILRANDNQTVYAKIVRLNSDDTREKLIKFGGTFQMLIPQDGVNRLRRKDLNLHRKTFL